jgi:aminoglycoside N3'-acetyltransferase
VQGEEERLEMKNEHGRLLLLGTEFWNATELGHAERFVGTSELTNRQLPLITSQFPQRMALFCAKVSLLGNM